MSRVITLNDPVDPRLVSIFVVVVETIIGGRISSVFSTGPITPAVLFSSQSNKRYSTSSYPRKVMSSLHDFTKWQSGGRPTRSSCARARISIQPPAHFLVLYFLVVVAKI